MERPPGLRKACLRQTKLPEKIPARLSPFRDCGQPVAMAAALRLYCREREVSIFVSVFRRRNFRLFVVFVVHGRLVAAGKRALDPAIKERCLAKIVNAPSYSSSAFCQWPRTGRSRPTRTEQHMRRAIILVLLLMIAVEAVYPIVTLVAFRPAPISPRWRSLKRPGTKPTRREIGFLPRNLLHQKSDRASSPHRAGRLVSSGRQG